jgi:kinesin family protein 6/9
MAEKSSAEVNIQTYLRIRPSKKPSGFFVIDASDGRTLDFNLPDTFRSTDYINNTKLHHHFEFTDVIPMEVTQEDVFKKVGVAAVRNALDGYNSTVFAYGQTGT